MYFWSSSSFLACQLGACDLQGRLRRFDLCNAAGDILLRRPGVYAQQWLTGLHPLTGAHQHFDNGARHLCGQGGLPHSLYQPSQACAAGLPPHC
jgi:hypothetical protein